MNQSSAVRSVGRACPATVVIIAAGVVVASLAASLALARTIPASGHGSSDRIALARSAPSMRGGMTPKLIACQRQHRQICGPASYRALVHALPLSKPDSRGVRRADGLLTEQQFLSTLGWSNATVGAALMTYSQAQSQYPALAAGSSLIVDPSREVWVGTRYYNPPVTVPAADGFGPNGVTGDWSLSSESIVVDAVTGQQTDYCMNCTTVAAVANDAKRRHPRP
jgi:hypothetical protein